jgi:lipopolysaccharide transport system ATP-binding protein
MVEPQQQVRIVHQAPWFILDDFFPNLLTGFRVAEYNAHLQAFPQMQIMSSLAEFTDHFSAYRLLYPELAQRIGQYVPSRLQGAKFAYITFLNNAHQYLDDLTRFQIPFVLNLYPGGGLGLNEAESDQKLLRMLASPLLKAIIVTQHVVENYLIQLAQANSLRLPPLHFIQGVVANPDYFNDKLTQHGPRYGFGKEVLDVCFVAENYMAGAANKGFPEFVQAMQGLHNLPQLRMHLVGGGYSPAEYQVPGLGGSIQYHGRLSTTQLREFFAQMDIIVSPSRPDLLHAGNFDGFPTAACVEAALCQVAIVATDALQQNPGYIEQESIFLLQHEAHVSPVALHIEQVIRHLALHPGLLSKVATQGQLLTQILYAPEKQIASRQDILRKAAT